MREENARVSRRMFMCALVSSIPLLFGVQVYVSAVYTVLD